MTNFIPKAGVKQTSQTSGWMSPTGPTAPAEGACLHDLLDRT